MMPLSYSFVMLIAALVMQVACECGEGEYGMDSVGGCMACDKCSPGTGVVRPCSSGFNTVCQRCPVFTYSLLKELGHRRCVRCSDCRPDQVMIQNCTADLDTVCMDEAFRLLAEGRGRVNGSSRQEVAGSQYNSTDIPIYCAILGTVILLVLLYVAARYWRLREAPRKFSCTSVELPVNAITAAGRTNSSCPTEPAELQIEPLFSVGLKTRMLELSSVERRYLETELSSCWTSLASLLGYGQDSVRLLQETAQRRNVTPARLLVADWSARPDATVTSFSRALSLIGRLDLAALVEQTCRDNFV